MSRIDEMIKELCPEGVERVKLSSLCNSICTGLNPRTNFKLNEEGAELKYVTVKEIATNKIVFSDSTDKISERSKEIINKRSRLEKGDILFSGIGTIGKVVYVDIETENWDCSESVFLLKPNEHVYGKYLSYSLVSKYVVSQYESCAAGAIMKGVRKATLENLEIPLPPLSIQQEIVSVLDSFTTLIDKMKQEMEKRKKQMEYYREKLLTFEDGECEWNSLKEIFETRNGYTPSTSNNEFWDEGLLPWFKMEDIREGGRILSDSTNHITPKAIKGKGLFKANSIILATSATIGEHALITVEHLSNQRFTNFYPKKAYESILDMKYVHYYFFLIDEWCKEHTIQGSFAGVNMTDLYNYLFPIPSLAKQAEIVSTLDKFESYISKLEKMIELRQKQYEYYRERLLTF